MCSLRSPTLRVPASHRSSHALYGYAANANIVSCGTQPPASALHTDVAWKAQQAKHGCAAGSTATLHRPAVTAPAGRTGLAHRALQRIVPHGVTAARPLHVRPRCLAARRHRLPRSSPQSATATARCIDSLHRFARRLAASTRCILSLVKSPHRLALHWLTASQPWVGGEDGFCGGFEA